MGLFVILTKAKISLMTMYFFIFYTFTVSKTALVAVGFTKVSPFVLTGNSYYAII